MNPVAVSEIYGTIQLLYFWQTRTAAEVGADDSVG